LQSHRNGVYRLTPEERDALKCRMVELRVRMDELRNRLTPAKVPEWIRLYNERQAIEDLLGDDE
jgi:hypothetical protein